MPISTLSLKVCIKDLRTIRERLTMEYGDREEAYMKRLGEIADEIEAVNEELKEELKCSPVVATRGYCEIPGRWGPGPTPG